MKLAEALSLRADLQKRIANIGQRLNANAKVQEGDKPAEDPYQLLTELDEMIQKLEKLIARINRTNNLTLDGDSSLTELIAKRDALSYKISILREFLQNASAKVERYSNTEIRIESTVKVSKLQKQVDKLSKELRELDIRIQCLNWSTELL